MPQRMDLRSVESNVYSQNGEDGILRHLFELLNIRDGWMCEFGASDGIQFSNTFQFVNAKDSAFRCLMIEADAAKYANLQKTARKCPNIVPLLARVDHASDHPQRLDALLAQFPDIPPDFELLSVDIASYDYQVWMSLECYAPKIVVIEVNGCALPHDSKWIHDNKMYEGTGFLPMLQLGLKKGYVLVSQPGNMIFVRCDIAVRLPLIPARVANPMLLFNSNWLPKEAFAPPRRSFPVPLSPPLSSTTSSSTFVSSTIVVRTNRVTRGVETLVKDIGTGWLLIDEDDHSVNGSPTNSTKSEDKHLMRSSSAKASNPLHRHNPRSSETGLLALHRALPESIEFVWIVSPRVRCTGSWEKVLSRALSDASIINPLIQRDATKEQGFPDFVATSVEPWIERRDDGWYWWCNNEVGATPPMALRWKAYMPLYGISRRLLRVLASEIGRWTAFEELFLPTFAGSHESGNFKLANLPPHVLGVMYRWNDGIHLTDWETTASGRYERNRLYCPVEE